MVSPYFSPKKLTTFFSHRPPKSEDLFSCNLTTSTLSPFQRRAAAKKVISFGCHPLDGVTRGGPPPPFPPVTLLQILVID